MKLTIVDIQGRVQFEKENISINGAQFSETISLTSFSSGLYFYALTDGTKQVFSGKFIKR
jgi:hypothetical protein